MTFETIILEDNIEYVVVDEIDEYVYLANANDSSDFCIRKISGEFIVPLDSETEFNKALALFSEKKNG